MHTRVPVIAHAFSRMSAASTSVFCKIGSSSYWFISRGYLLHTSKHLNLDVCVSRCRCGVVCVPVGQHVRASACAPAPHDKSLVMCGTHGGTRDVLCTRATLNTADDRYLAIKTIQILRSPVPPMMTVPSVWRDPTDRP